LYISAEEFQQHCQPTRPCCLLLDVHLPGMSGLELLSRLHQTNCAIPVILMTESLEERILTQAQNSGSFAFFPKPFNINALLDGIQSARQQSAADPSETDNSAKSDSGHFIVPD